MALQFPIDSEENPWYIRSLFSGANGMIDSAGKGRYVRPSKSVANVLFPILQWINLHTQWAAKIKDRLGLQRFATSLFAHEISPQEAEAIIESLNDHAIADRVADLAAKGVDKPTFLVLLIELMGDIVACEPIARHLKKLAPG